MVRAVYHAMQIRRRHPGETRLEEVLTKRHDVLDEMHACEMDGAEAMKSVLPLPTSKTTRVSSQTILVIRLRQDRQEIDIDSKDSARRQQQSHVDPSVFGITAHGSPVQSCSHLS